MQVLVSLILHRDPYRFWISDLEVIHLSHVFFSALDFIEQNKNPWA